MKCLILAAGYATRLYPLTESFPKPLLTVKGKPILDWLLEDISASGVVDRYMVVTNHKFAAQFRAWAGSHTLPVDVVDDGTESNESRLGAVCDIQLGIEALSLSDDLMIIAGDNLLDFSLNGFIDYQKKKRSSVIMRYWEPDQNRLHKSGVAEVDENDLVTHMEEKPQHPRSNWCTPPFYILQAADLGLVRKGIESGCSVDAPGSLIAWLSNHTVIHAYEMPGHRYDIGNLESLNDAQKNYHGILQKEPPLTSDLSS